MCGIAGLYDVRDRQPFAPELIRRMTKELIHRGPDGDGFFEAPGIALGHRRLSIIDLAGGAQPMSLADGSVHVTFNGEIYNYLELKADLAGRGAQFRTNSDTEVLLHGWRIWQEGLLERLTGMFAFALWDAQSDTLFLARDRLGKKPLHYARLVDGTFAFGSEIRSITSVPGQDWKLDPESIDDFFTYGYIPDPRTIYAGIHKLLPGHCMSVQRGSSESPRRYWDIADAAATYGHADFSPDILTDRLRRSTKLRLVSDVDVGAFLSGGVDSSAVVAMMALETEGRVNSFAIGFDDKKYDETAFAEVVARRYGTNHRSKQVSPDGFGLIEAFPRIFGEPFGDVSAIPTFSVCAETAQYLKVCLSGDGGDEILGGYRRYRFHWAEERVRGLLPDPFRRSLFGLAGVLYPKLDWAPRPLRAKTTFSELALDADEAYFRMVAALPDEVRLPLYSETFRSNIADRHPADMVRACYKAVPEFDSLQKAQYTDINTYLPGDILVKVDRTSMANSLEVRAPFLDHDFAAWSLAMPSYMKLHGNDGKAVLKKAMEAYLPNDLLYRPKQGFTVPLSAWLRGPLSSLVTALGKDSALAKSELFDTDVVQARTRAHLEGREDQSKSLWLLLVFDRFLAANAI